MRAGTCTTEMGSRTSCGKRTSPTFPSTGAPHRESYALEMLDPISVPHAFKLPKQLRSIDLLSDCVPEQSMPLCSTQVIVY